MDVGTPAILPLDLIITPLRLGVNRSTSLGMCQMQQLVTMVMLRYTHHNGYTKDVDVYHVHVLQQPTSQAPELITNLQQCM